MKKNFTITIAALMALAVSFSCAKEENAPNSEELIQSPEEAVDNNEPAADVKLVPFSFTVEGTKTYIDDSGTPATVQWVEGESMAVYDGTAIREFTMTSLDPLKFEGSIAESASFAWAVYPYSASGISGTSTTVTATLPAVQALSGHNVATGALLTAGKINLESKSVTLQNLHGTVSFTVGHDDITELSVIGTNLAGTATFSELGAISGEVSEAASEIVLTPAGETFTKDERVYIAALPGATITGVAAKRTDGYKGTKAVASKTLARNKGFAAGDFEDTAIEWVYKASNADELMAWHSGHTAAWNTAVKTNYPNATNHKVLLTGDINLSGKNWTWKHLRCEFDGAGHKIYNVVIQRATVSGENQPAFFNQMYADIHDIIFGSSDGVVYDGVSKIVNQTTTAKDFWAYAALLHSAQADITIENITNFIPVSTDADALGKFRLGGILGVGGNGSTTVEVKNCKNYGAVTDNTTTFSTNGEGNMLGGIVGVCNDGASAKLTIDNCTNYGTISATQPRVGPAGGIMARIYPSAGGYCLIDGCTNEGIITYSQNENTSVYNYVGGILGIAHIPDDQCTDGSDAYKYQIKDCTNNGAISISTVRFCVGGILGYGSAMSVTGCSNTKGVTATATGAAGTNFSTAAAGIVGATGTYGNNSSISSGAYTINYNSTYTAKFVLNNNRNSGTINATHNSDESGSNAGRCGAVAGGIAGGIKGYASVSGNVNTGDVTCANNYSGKYAYAGGITANLYSVLDMNAPTFTGNKNSGTITAIQNSGGSANRAVGGIVGKLQASISSCENYGDISGTAAMTGLIVGMGRPSASTHNFKASSCKILIGSKVNSTAATDSNYKPSADPYEITAYTNGWSGTSNIGVVFFGQVNATSSGKFTISGTTSTTTAPTL